MLLNPPRYLELAAELALEAQAFGQVTTGHYATTGGSPYSLSHKIDYFCQSIFVNTNLDEKYSLFRRGEVAAGSGMGRTTFDKRSAGAYTPTLTLPRQGGGIYSFCLPEEWSVGLIPLGLQVSPSPPPPTRGGGGEGEA